MKIRQERGIGRLEALALAVGLTLAGSAAAMFVGDERIAADRLGGFTIVDRAGRVVERLTPLGAGEFRRQSADGHPRGTLEDMPGENGYALRDAQGRIEGEVHPHPFGAMLELRDAAGRVIGLIQPGRAPGELRLEIN